MKKILLGIALSVVVLQGCKKDNDDDEVVAEITVTEQNTYDDAAAKDFMTKNYLNSKGVITAFDDTVDTDNNEKKLSDYEYKTLPSGVIYIIRPGAQPEPGKELGATDVITLFHSTSSYVVTKTDDKITFSNQSPFINNITGGNPTSDPAYYHVKTSVLEAYNKANSTTYGRDFFEMEGLKEGLKFFNSFDNLDPATDYNMQGIIIVPSRAAYARDNTIYGDLYRNRSFVFNFQLWNSKTRTTKED